MFYKISESERKKKLNKNLDDYSLYNLIERFMQTFFVVRH